VNSGYDKSDSGYGVSGGCEHGISPSCFIKCGEFPHQLWELLTSQEGLCFMESI